MAYLIGSKPSPPDQWYQLRLARQVNRAPSEIPAAAWVELAMLAEMDWMVQAQDMLTGGQAQHLSPDTMLALKSLRDEAKKQWPKN
jgi:hypothetical protein